MHCHFEFICFFANIIEKCFLMRSRYKKFKEAEFFTRIDKFCCALSLRVYLLLCKYYREAFFNAFSIQKIQRGRIFQRTDRFLMRSRYKNSKRQNFLLELTQSLRVYLLFCKYYREAVLLLEFSIQKFKEAEFFNELTGF